MEDEEDRLDSLETPYGEKLKELRANAPLPYPHLVTLFLHYFKIPLDDEPFIQVKRSFANGAGAVTLFGNHKDDDGQWVR